MKGFLSNLNFCLLFAGYPLLVTIYSIFLAGTLNLQLLTIPYRLFTLIVSLLVIYNNWGNPIRGMKQWGWLLAYGCMLSFRMVYDFFFDTDLFIPIGEKIKPLLFWFCITLPALFAAAKSYKTISFRKVYVGLVAIYAFIGICNLLFNRGLFDANFAAASEGRVDGGEGLNTISFSYCGVSLATLAFFLNGYLGDSALMRFVRLVLMGIGLFIVLKTGSRGPFLVLLMIFIFILYMKMKTDILMLLVGMLCFSFLLLFSGDILDTLGEMFPVLFSRLHESASDDERRALWNMALDIFEQYPLFGRYLGLYVNNTVCYSHNAFADAAVLGGLCGVICLSVIYIRFFKDSVFLYKADKVKFGWIITLFMQGILSILFSGTIYYMYTVMAGCAFLSLWSDKEESRCFIDEI
ncbi:MAG: O-antigen ligase family protein [Paraprevotella sp.]|nr:O-antigen ligase family protein [Paraprevotella sp.]